VRRTYFILIPSGRGVESDPSHRPPISEIRAGGVLINPMSMYVWGRFFRQILYNIFQTDSML